MTVPQGISRELGIGEFPPESHILVKEAQLRLDISNAMWTSHSPKFPEGVMVHCPTRRVSRDGRVWQKGTWVDWLRVCKLLMSQFSLAKRNKAASHLRDLGFDTDGTVLDAEKGVLRLTTQDFKAIEFLKTQANPVVKSDTRAVQKQTGTYSEMGFGKWSRKITGAWFDEAGDPVYTTAEPSTLPPAPATTPKPKSGGRMVTIPETEEELDYTDDKQVAAFRNRNAVEQEKLKTLKLKVEVAKASNASIEVSEVENLLSAAMVAIRATLDQSVDKAATDVISLILTKLAQKFPKLQREFEQAVDIFEVRARLREDSEKSLSELSQTLLAFSKSLEEAEEEDYLNPEEE